MFRSSSGPEPMPAEMGLSTPAGFGLDSGRADAPCPAGRVALAGRRDLRGSVISETGIDVEARRHHRLPLGALLAPLGVALALGLSCGQSEDAIPAACRDDANTALFDRRIAPLLGDDRPKSCNACHLSGVDMALFVRDTPCETMACLGELGLVDLATPEASTVLAWIERATPTGGITEESIATEREAMLEWIETIAACDGQLCAPVEDPCGAPPDWTDCEFPPPVSEPMSLDDPGDCSDLTLELVWREKAYSWRGRCFPCHFDSHDDTFELAPPFIRTGECNAASLLTLHEVEARGYLDPVDPMQSLLLTKPLDEALGGVEHGGGPKLHALDEPTYVDFAYFAQRWADCQ